MIRQQVSPPYLECKGAVQCTPEQAYFRKQKSAEAVIPRALVLHNYVTHGGSELFSYASLKEQQAKVFKVFWKFRELWSGKRQIDCKGDFIGRLINQEQHEHHEMLRKIRIQILHDWGPKPLFDWLSPINILTIKLATPATQYHRAASSSWASAAKTLRNFFNEVSRTITCG